MKKLPNDGGSMYIAIGIVLFISLLLYLPLILRVEYKEGDYSLILRYAFLRFDLLKTRPKKKKKKRGKKKAKNEEPGKPPGKPPDKKKKSLGEKLELANGMLKMLNDTRRYLFRHLILSDITLNIKICSLDAAKTAEDFGKVSWAVYSFISLLRQYERLFIKRVDIVPDFFGDETTVYLFLNVKIRVYALIMTAAHAAIGAYKLYTKPIKMKEEQA